MDIGNKIRQVRKEKGLTQKELGFLAGMSYQQIGQYENGKRTPKLETIDKIAQALKISPYEMLGDQYTYMKYPNLKEIGIKQEAFEKYLNSLGYLVNIICTPVEISKEDMEKIIRQRPDWKGDEDSISCETMDYELIKNNKKIVLTDDEYRDLQKNIENFTEFELWKSTKQDSIFSEEVVSPNQDKPDKNQ